LRRKRKQQFRLALEARSPSPEESGIKNPHRTHVVGRLERARGTATTCPRLLLVVGEPCW
jgi:hypothetical protein